MPLAPSATKMIRSAVRTVEKRCETSTVTVPACRVAGRTGAHQEVMRRSSVTTAVTSSAGVMSNA